ncbi:hypothetical protein NDS46_18880 [Paenibacillus thiaminolyticus]|nr:hypothetical protein [Paenibacillus thiaminolyticus]WCF06412.1 hypothetical protein NDS46_18880 [Paenibacillus thiaminolyticus]
MNPLQPIRAIPDRVEAALVAASGRLGLPEAHYRHQAQGIVFRNE